MGPSLYRTLWRWHFYAGVFVLPMIVILSLTGAVFLFKPQIDRWEERAWRGLPVAGAVTPDTQVAAALASYPGAQLSSYRLPEAAGDAALVHLRLAGRAAGEAGAMRDVFVSPQGRVVGVLDPEARIASTVQTIHGQLLLGRRGSWLVELAASWAIVLVVTGLALWWPRGRGPAGVVWPRLGRGARTAWRDLHAVTGFWVSGLALVLLLTGLPWADAWGSAFKAVRAEMGWVKGAQDWTVGGRAPPPQVAQADEDGHAGHDHVMMAGTMMMHDHHAMMMPRVTLADVVAKARREHLAFPVLVAPPGADAAAWTVKSDTQNRPLRMTIRYDARTGRELSRKGFADGHPIDRVVGYGVAWHEGQLFGAVNQAIGVLTAVMLVMMAVTGFVLWRRRKPADGLGAPPRHREGPPRWLVPLVLMLAAFLPLLAASLVVVVVFDRLVLPLMPGLARWLGVAAPA